MSRFPAFSANRFALLFMVLLSSACSSELSEMAQFESASGRAIVSAGTLELSPTLTNVFVQSCAGCHTKASTGAPLAGDVPVWRAILSKGLDATLDRTFNGYQGMPPAGQCFECSPEQMTQLIAFMAQGA